MSSKLKSLIGLLALAIAVGGCGSSYKGGEKTSESIKGAAQRIDSVNGEIDATVASLNKLTTAAPGTDLRPLFKDYSSHVDKLDSSAQTARKRAEEMKAKGQAYFKEWDEQLATMHNEDIKTRSLERRQAVESSFQRIREKSVAVSDAYRPLMSDFKDIRTALGNDLTANGIATIKPIADRVAGEAAKVKEAASALSVEFKSLGVQMSPSGK